MHVGFGPWAFDLSLLVPFPPLEPEFAADLNMDTTKC